MITCPSPAASNITAGSKPAPVDFYLNGRLYADEHPALDEEMYPEEALHISKFSLEYYADPQFFTAKKEKWIKHHPGEPLTLVIHVRERRLQLSFFGGVVCSPRGSSSGLSPSTVAVQKRRRGKGGGRGRSRAGAGSSCLACCTCTSLHQETQPDLRMPFQA